MTPAISTSLSLYQIEFELAELLSVRDQAEAEGDSEALVAIDAQIAAYKIAEPRKADSYIAVMFRASAKIDACDAELDRIKAIRKREQDLLDRMKANALAAMQNHGVKEIRGSLHSMRVQNNGGLLPLEISAWPKDSSGRFAPQPYDGTGALPASFMKLLAVPNTEAIREALKRGEEVPGAKLLERGSHLRVD
jgi:Siphovirus Gp157